MNDQKLVQKLVRVLIALSMGILVGACQSAPAAPVAERIPGLANPASVHCKEQGGNLEMRQDDNGGTFAVCVFADGSECEEWTFFRGDCQPAGDQPAGSINPATAHRLNQAVKLEILESVVDEPVVEREESVVDDIVSRVIVDDPEAISALVSSLDDDFGFTNRVRCPAHYTLIFTLADGTVESFSYHCLNGEAAILWGDHIIWHVWAIDAPNAFQTTLQALLGGSG